MNQPKHIAYAFQASLKNIALKDIQTMHPFPEGIRGSVKFKSILASVEEIGVIEPLAVYEENGKYLLLDGHLRLLALQELGIDTVVCLLSTDDEGFTYNRQINRLSPIQEYRMISRAISKGIPREKIAKTLNINLSGIESKLNLLNDIAPEVAAKLADKHLAQDTFRILRKMKPIRQMEAADMMIAANKFTKSYAEMILVASSQEDLVDHAQKKKKHSDSLEKLSLLEQEMDRLKEDYTRTEKEISDTNLSLIVAGGYLKRLLDNSAVKEFISLYYADILTAFDTVSQQLQQAPMSLEKE